MLSGKKIICRKDSLLLLFFFMLKCQDTNVILNATHHLHISHKHTAITIHWIQFPHNNWLNINAEFLIVTNANGILPVFNSNQFYWELNWLINGRICLSSSQCLAYNWRNLNFSIAFYCCLFANRLIRAFEPSWWCFQDKKKMNQRIDRSWKQKVIAFIMHAIFNLTAQIAVYKVRHKQKQKEK